MKVKMRDIVDISQHVETHNLPVMEALTVGIRKAWTNRKSYQRKLANKETEKQLERQQRIDSLREVILYHVDKYLLSQETKLNQNKNVTEITVTISRHYRDVLYEVVTSKELLGFKIEKVKEQPDMLRAFPNLPILVKISKRKLENDKEGKEDN